MRAFNISHHPPASQPYIIAPGSEIPPGGRAFLARGFVPGGLSQDK
jgi:hypothetical protein